MDKFSFDPLLCGTFCVSLLFHFYCASLILMNANYTYYTNNCKKCNYDKCSVYSSCDCQPSILSPHVDIKYVFAMMMLVITNQCELMCIVSSAVFINAYIKYFINSYKYKHNFDNNVALALFLSFWLSVYYISKPDTFVPYMMLLASGSVNQF